MHYDVTGMTPDVINIHPSFLIDSRELDTMEKLLASTLTAEEANVDA